MKIQTSAFALQESTLGLVVPQPISEGELSHRVRRVGSFFVWARVMVVNSLANPFRQDFVAEIVMVAIDVTREAILPGIVRR